MVLSVEGGGRPVSTGWVEDWPISSTRWCLTLSLVISTIRAVKFADRDNSLITKFEQSLKKTKEGLEETRPMVKDISKIVSRSKSPVRQVTSSPIRSRTGNDRDANRNYECFSVIFGLSII
jgi:hypothetical protein